MTAAPDPGRGRGTLTRGRVVVAVLVLGALALGASALPWASVAVPTVLGDSTVTVAGAELEPVTTAASVVVLAAGLAISFGGRWVGRLAAFAVALFGGLIATMTVNFLRDPLWPLRRAAAQVGGVPEIVGEPTFTVWPYVTVVLGAALVGAAVLAFRLPTTVTGRRFERPGAAAPRPPRDERDARAQAMDDWDALGRGEDPSTPEQG